MGDSGRVCHQFEAAYSPNEHEQRHGKQYVSHTNHMRFKMNKQTFNKMNGAMAIY